jgi:phosphonate transport system permease protein
MALCLASWLFILQEDGRLSVPFFSSRTLDSVAGFLRDLLGLGGARTPAFLQLGLWKETAGLAYDTLAMAVLGIGIAGSLAFVTFMFGARNLMFGEMAPHPRPVSGFVFWTVRAFFILCRGVPELVWALIALFVFSPGILPGALALGVHNAGILGKLASEVVEGMDARPLRALRSSGAGYLQLLLFGVLPQALPRFLTYLLYRWEVVIRTTIVVGFVAAGGLGMEFRLAMSHFHYTTVTLLLLWYLFLVLGVDVAAAGLRRLAR